MGASLVRSILMLSAIALVVASCGGVDLAKEATVAPELSAQGSANVPAKSAAEDEAEDEAETESQPEPAAPGERYALITIDGQSTSYALDGITYSNVEGMNDITFERCDPDFFGSGRFYAIGHAVDAEGQLLLAEDGGPAGTFTMDLPPADWEAAERDAPEFDIQLNELDIRMATAGEAAGAPMTWMIDDARASGTAVFVDFENTYTVDFEIVCEGTAAAISDAPPATSDGQSGDSASDLSGGGSGSYTVDGEVFDGVAVYACEPFSAFGDPHPEDISLFAQHDGSEGINVAISHAQGFDPADGSQFDQITIEVFHSRQGSQGIEQFDGSAVNDANGAWFRIDPETFQQTPLETTPFAIDGDRITGSLAGLLQSWPDAGAETVDVSFDLEIPNEVNESC